MTVFCRFCGDVLTLPEDSNEAREAGTDPLRQMSRHIGKCGGALRAGFNAAVLVSALAFRAPYEPERHRKNIQTILDWLIAGGIEDPNFVPNSANAKPTEAGTHGKNCKRPKGRA
jgi:hypothetical protein